MKKIFLIVALLSLTACEGSTARGFWGPSAERPMCTLFGDCGGTRSCEMYGNCDGAPTETSTSAPVKSCELYGNCE